MRGSAYIWSTPDPDEYCHIDQHPNTDHDAERYSDLRDRDAAADSHWRAEPYPYPDLRADKHGDQHASAERDADQHVTRADQHAEAPAADPADYGAARADPADGW